jgi:hypothetical protein
MALQIIPHQLVLRIVIGCVVAGMKDTAGDAVMLKCNVWIRIFALLLASHMRVVATDWPSAEPESVGLASDRLAQIHPVIRRFMEVEKLPCAITVIARRGKVIYCDKIGFQDLERTEKGRRTFAVEKWAAQMVIRGCELREE